MDDRFRLSREAAERLATEFGTPLYVLDEAHLRGRMRAYRDAARAASPRSEVTYASKANSTLAVLRIAHQEGLRLDVASEGELRAALAAGVPAGACHLHGNNKSAAEIEFALAQGVGHFVADNLPELDRYPRGTRVVLRLAPGVDPVTHAKISTGQDDTKFGFNVADGAAETAVARCVERGLALYGFHCHVGSRLVDPEAQRAAGETIARFARLMLRHGVRAEYLNVGGGLGVRYTVESPMPTADYCRLVTQAVRDALGGELDPIIAQEPGRALVAESGVTLYRVGVVKEVPSAAVGRRLYACVDGGLSDNPRPALYGARYTVEAPGSAGFGPRKTFTVSGKHCETDLLFPDVALPADLAPGDLLQVLTTGAYNSAMASNYNRFPRPAAVLVREDGRPLLVQRRETWDELLGREVLPEGL